MCIRDRFYLSILADFNPSIPKIVFDGIFGQATRSAVIAFQNQFGLTADGLVGPQTLSLIHILSYTSMPAARIRPCSRAKSSSSGGVMAPRAVLTRMAEGFIRR